MNADVKGHLAVEDKEDATAPTITGYHRLMPNQIQNQGGRVMRAKGDNLVAECFSAVEVLVFGVDPRVA